MNQKEILPNGWKWAKLNELCDKISLNKIKIKQKQYLTEGRFPVVDQGQDLIGGYYDDSNLVIPGEPPFIVFGDHTKVKKFVPFKFIAGADGVKVLKAKEVIDPKYLYYSLFTIKIEDKGYARHFQLIEKELFPLPPKNIQKNIVSKIEELFSELDKGIENLRLAQQQLKTYRQAVLKWAFEGRLTEEWRKKNDLPNIDKVLSEIRLKGKEAGVKNKYGLVKVNEDNKLLPIPGMWRWIRNEELMLYVTSGSRDWKKYYASAGSYFIRTQNLNTNSLDLSDAAYVELPEKVEGKRSLVETGDLLMTITGANVGKVAFVDHEIQEAYVSQSVALMKYLDKRMVKYLWYYFQCKDFGQGLISGLVYGVGRPVLSLENMKEVPVALCSFEEQEKIVQEIEGRLSQAEKIEENITHSLQQAEALRQSVLKWAFEGRLV